MEMSPEQQQLIQALLENGSATYGDQEKTLEAQLAHAHALAMRPLSQHTTGLGGALGAVGDTLSAYGANKREQSALDQQKALQERYIEALKQGMRPPPAADPGVPPMLQRPEGQ